MKMSKMGVENGEKIGIFQIAVLILSVLVLGALGADTVFKFPKAISDVLQVFDAAVCILLLVDFFVRFYGAKSKLAFLKWGWIDFIACIPNIPLLRFGRLVRILRVIRLLRAIVATRRIGTMVFKNSFQVGIASVVLTSFLIIIFCSIGILICEQQDPNANIKTGGDALWWSVTTITTVGYGDKYPITAEGRVLAMTLMISGVGLFGVFSGLAATFFLGKQRSEDVENENKILAKLQTLEEKMDELKRNQR